MENKKTNHIEILDRLIVGLRANKELPENYRDAAIEELEKYKRFDFDDLDTLRARWSLLEDDEELAEKRIISDLNLEKAKAHLDRCKSRLLANITYGKELKKMPSETEGG